jgi:hypothetical protein
MSVDIFVNSGKKGLSLSIERPSGPYQRALESQGVGVSLTLLECNILLAKLPKRYPK